MDLFTLSAKLQLDKSDYEQGLRDSETSAESSGSKISSIFGATAKATIAGIAATTTAVAGLVKSSVDGYSEFQQLEGGIETLFGDSANIVMENAKKAYKSAGKDANDYMNTVIGMAGALNKATGDMEKSADLADMAIVDMSDNVNKMGTNMEMVQNAYVGFSRGNFTMLDNLALGFSGTKEGMQELLDSAQAISGVEYNIDSYADIVEAIHVVQTEMGITGTTANEAATTIQGSLSMTKEAWENLITGLTNPDADISQVIDNRVESAKAATSNLIPAISQALEGVGQLVQGLAPVISKELPKLIKNVLPMLLDAGITLFNGLIDALPDLMNALFEQLPTLMTALVDAIVELLPMIIELGLQLIMTLAQGIMEALPELIPALIEMVLQIVDFLTNPDNLTQLIEASVQIILALVNGLIEALPKLIEALPTIVQNIVTALINNLPLLIDATIQIIMAIAQALIENIPLLLDALMQITFALINGIILAIPDILTAIGDLVVEVLATLVESLPQFVSNGVSLIQSLISGIVSMIGTVVQAIIKLVTNIIQAIKNRFERLKEVGKNMIEAVKNGISEKIEDAKQWGKDLIDNFIGGIKEKWQALKDTVSDVAQSVKDFLGFSEPKLGPLSNFHTYAPDMMDLFMQGVRDNKSALIDTVSDAFNFQNLITAPELNTSVVGTPSGGVNGDYGTTDSNVTNQTWNVNIYQPMKSAVDVARTLREEAQYGLLGGGEALA